MIKVFGLYRHISNKKGNSSILLMFMTVVVMSLMTLTADAGLLYIEKGKLQNTVDSVALAAISKYSKGQESMLAEAYKYSNLNGFPAEQLGIVIAESNRRITVSASKAVSLFFARLLGRTSAEVSVKATAIAGPITAMKGIRPFGVEMQEFIFATPYDLKEGGGEGTTGNYGALSLGGTGASNYRTNLINGYDDSVLRVGDIIETEPGNMNGPTLDGIRAILDSDSHSHLEDLSSIEVGCPRVIIIPVVDSLDVEGRSEVTIVGFSSFFIDDVVYDSGQTTVTGRFLETIGEGAIDETGTGYGFYGTKLVE